MNQQKVLPWLFVTAGSLTALAVPFVFSKIVLGSYLPPVLTQLESDSLYYLTMVKAVLQGDIWAGNPFIFEYRSAMLPALALPLWLCALPGLLGLSINNVFLVNALLYGMLTGAVFFILNRKILEGHPWVAALIAVLGVASLSNLILRPMLMQTVYPVFGLFMIALYAVLERPWQRNRYILLGIVTAITFYLYPHLWTQTFSALGVLYLWALLRREWLTVKYLTLMGIGVIIICTPQIWLLMESTRDPEMALMSMRNGLIETEGYPIS